MKQHLGAVTLLVRDYDEAIGWFSEKLGFILLEDTPLGQSKRWVIMAPAGSTEARLLLARAERREQAAQIGAQAGGRVAFFLYTDDFGRDHARMIAGGVEFLEAPRHESYGTVAVFRDCCGNKWDLIQAR